MNGAEVMEKCGAADKANDASTEEIVSTQCGLWPPLISTQGFRAHAAILPPKKNPDTLRCRGFLVRRSLMDAAGIASKQFPWCLSGVRDE